MNQNINNYTENDNPQSKNKNIIIFVIIAVLILLVIGSYMILQKPKDTNIQNDNKNEPENEIVEIEDQLWYDFNNGIINVDEYVRNCIYNQYDPSLLDEKYTPVSGLALNNIIDKYYDQLSEETIKLYLDYFSLSNLTFKIDNDTPTVKPLASRMSNKETTNLNKVHLSSKGNFLIWYTSSGESAVDFSIVERYAELLEDTILKYDEIFGTNYYFKASVISKGKRYEEQLEVLNYYNIDEKYMEDAMHIYIYDLKSKGGEYNSTNEQNNKLIDFVNNLFNNGNEDGTIITPYIVLNSAVINSNEYDFASTVIHELFHHYQNYIINNTGTRKMVIDNIIGEATAQWAASKVAENNLKNNSLNIWASNYIKKTNVILTDMYSSEGHKVGYAMAKFMYSYENNVGNSKAKIFKSIHEENGLKYLHDNATLDERNKAMADLALKNLNHDYPNNNYLPKGNTTIIPKKEISDKSVFSDNFNLSAIGIDYYLFNSNLKNNYNITITSDGNWASVYVIGLKNGKYEVLLSKNNINGNTSINTSDYKNYEKLYLVITNSDFDKSHDYKIDVKSSTIKNETTFNTNFNNYKIKATSTMVMYGMETISYIDGVVDELHQKEFLETTTTVMGFNVSTSTYVDFANGYTYTQNPLSNVWEKSEDATSLVDLSIFLDKFKENGSVTKVNANQYQVKLTEDDIKGLLKYNSNLNQYDLKGDIFATVHIKDNYVSKLEYDFSSLIDGIDKFTMEIEFYDHNQAGDVNIPTEVVQ